MNVQGTSLVCVAKDDGIYLAADDLVYQEHDGTITPLCRDFRKVGAFGSILYGSAGLMIVSDPRYKYDLAEFITDVVNKFESEENGLPSAFADQIYQRLRHYFAPAEPFVQQGIICAQQPGDRLLSYVVAGYTKNFQLPYVFEVGVDIHSGNNGLVYVAPIAHKKPLPRMVRFGEDYHYERAGEGFEPEQSALDRAIDTVLPHVICAFPDIGSTLHESVACTVGCIKVEAQFNSDKVGSKVNVALVHRESRSTLFGSF